MLERLAQLVVDKLEPKIERLVQSYLDELRLELKEYLVETYWESINQFNLSVSQTMPDIEKKLKKEITQQIVRGVKG